MRKLPIKPKWTTSLLSVVFLVSTVLFFPAKSTHSQEVITIGGTGSAVGFSKALAQAFEKSNPQIKIEVMPSIGSTGAIKAVARKALDIAISGRSLKSEEGPDLKQVKFAETPFVFVGGKKVNTKDITPNEVLGIYKGTLNFWPDGIRIRLILRPDTDIQTITLKKISPEMSKAVDLAHRREGILQAATDQENADIMAVTEGGFGTSGLTQIITEKRPLKVFSYNGVAPTVENLKKGSYPFSISYYFIVSKNESPEARKFIEFARGPEGALILEKSGCLSIRD
jgi:phosphate transport system substrate-binding protein